MQWMKGLSFCNASTPKNCFNRKTYKAITIKKKIDWQVCAEVHHAPNPVTCSFLSPVRPHKASEGLHRPGTLHGLVMAQTELNIGKEFLFIFCQRAKSDHCSPSSPTSNPPFDSGKRRSFRRISSSSFFNVSLAA